MAYIARRTRDKAAFLAPLTPCGQQKGAKRQFSPFFADFDQKTQKLHQNKPEIGIAHQFYIEKGITGVISGEVFFTADPPCYFVSGFGKSDTSDSCIIV